MDDLISRQLVMKTLCERRCGDKPKGCPSGFCTESLAVDCIPSAKPAQQWIPCSERLPEEFYVLCCDNYGEMIIANPFECDDSDTGFSAESEDCYMYNCVAWMPLPEPYKGEES